MLSPAIAGFRTGLYCTLSRAFEPGFIAPLSRAFEPSFIAPLSRAFEPSGFIASLSRALERSLYDMRAVKRVIACTRSFPIHVAFSGSTSLSSTVLMTETRTIKIAIVEDLREIRKGLARLINATRNNVIPIVL
jgi:hypothetical protein